MTEAAYSTDNPEIVAAYLGACARRRAQAHRIVAAVRKLGADPEKILANTDSISAPTIRGLTPLRRPNIGLPADDGGTTVYVKDYAVPEGWRIVRDRLEPRFGKPGAAARQWLEDHQPVDVRGIMEGFGLPRAVWVPDGRDFSFRILTPKLFAHDGTVWACFAAEPGTSDSGFDKTPCTWPRRKLSEFYAAKEANDAAAEAEKADA